jgi:ubiquinone/menaquinone biosynthesis C-methylase UbiE
MTKSETKEEKTRRKLLKQLNPVADFILSIVIMFVTPTMYLFSLIHDKLMFKFLNKTYIYNVSWEDPRMDQRVFNLDESDHVITIASAGCNVLDYIIKGAKVTAVDFNSCQIALTELKKVAILNIEYEQFFEIFSMSNMPLFRELYPSKLRPYLSAPSREFWDEKIPTFTSFMYSGTSGNMSWFLFRVLMPLFGFGFLRRDLANNITTEELKQKVAKCEYPLRTLAWILDNILLRGGCCFAGVPERQMNLGIHRPNNLAMVIERVFFRTDLVNDNYFYAGYILGYYKPHNCPNYLKKENFLVMRKYLEKGNLILFHGTLLDAIDQSKTKITVASLLDHMDWMTERMINDEITHLLRKMDMKRGKIFWRTFADSVHVAPLMWLEAEKVDDHDDRVGMYWTTWISHLDKVKYAYEERIDTKQTKGFINDCITGLKVVTFPFWRPLISSTLSVTGHANRMESFYKFQKEGYDAFREGLLHARPVLMESFPLFKGGNMVWFDVGGGTARNLEYFSPEIIRKYFKTIIIIDISTSLLEMAQERINRLKLNDIVQIYEYDYTDTSILKKLSSYVNNVDIITMSYSFSMIPDQQSAITNSIQFLKGNNNSYLAIADFFQDGSYDDCLPHFSRFLRKSESKFHKWWFSNDHVHLLSEEPAVMGEPELEKIWDNRFRGSVPFIPFMKPFHGVYIMKKTDSSQ